MAVSDASSTVWDIIRGDSELRGACFSDTVVGMTATAALEQLRRCCTIADITVDVGLQILTDENVQGAPRCVSLCLRPASTVYWCHLLQLVSL